MNKKGKGGVLIPVVAVLVVLLLGLAVYGIYQIKPTTTQTFTQTGAGAGTGGGTTVVTTNPTISVAAEDAQLSGTSVGNALTFSLNNGAFGSTPTTAVPGQTITMLVTNGTTYHNLVVPQFVAAVNSFPVKVKMNKNSTITENMYTTTGLVLANGVGVQNQTDLGEAQSYNLKDEMTPTSLTNTQDLLCVLELIAGTNATVSPAGAILSSSDGKATVTAMGTSTPSWYTPVGTGSRIWLYKVSALNGGQTYTFNNALKADTAKRFSATSYFKKACYTYENFIDPTSGQPAYDVADSQGTLKSMARYTYSAYFQ